VKASAIIAAFCIGIVQLFFLSAVWTLLGVAPLRWIVSLGLTYGEFRLVTSTFDVIVNLLLSLPAAYALCWLRPQKLPLYLALAVIPVFLWNYRLIFTDPSAFRDWIAFVPGVALSLLILPLAAMLIRWSASSK